MKKNHIKAVIFDMDGVISDTQKFHAKIECKILADHGINITPDDLIRRYAGTKDSEMFQKEFEKHKIKGDIAKIVNKKWKHMHIETKNNIPAITGVIKFINDLHSNNYLISVASGSPHHFIDSVLKELQIIEKFQLRVSSDDVINAKPSPDIFLLAAKKLGVHPDNCLVIEDATNGVIAAKAAGMKCIAITTTHKIEELNQADKIISSYDEISSDIIQSL